MYEIIVDNFAGGGGASTGIELATGRSVEIAINHDPAAIAMHRANHPNTEHYCESVWDIKPREVVKGRPVGLVWFSPDCKHFSKAKGGKPVEKRIRALAWVALRWAATVKPRVIMLENVEEFKTWGPIIPQRDPETGRLFKKVFLEDGESWRRVVAEVGEDVPINLRILIPDPKRKGITFRSFVNALKRQGYEVEWRELRACDYGAPTIRKRLFLVARCDGRPVVFPKPTHGDPNSPEVKSGKLKPWRTAAEIIDWSIPCKSIFDRKKPLAENTLRRIARGIQKFIINNPQPFVMRVNPSGIAAPYIARIGQTGFGRDRLQYEATNPLTTITTKAEHLLITPILGVNTSGHPGSPIDEPLRTITTGNQHMLISPSLIQMGYGDSEGRRVLHLDKPLGTVTAGGNKFALTAAFLAKHYGGGYTGSGNDLEDPLSTVTTVDHNALVTGHLVPSHQIGDGHYDEVRAFLLKYYGNEENGQALDEPLHTITTKDRFGLITIHGVNYKIIDIGMRMLEPHELFAAQGFPQNYIIDVDADGQKYPKSAQVARCGNAVPPPFTEALVRANLPELCVGAGKILTLERFKSDQGQLEFSL